MGSRRTTFDKLQRERAKKAKASAKRERRQERNAESDETEEGVDGPTMSMSELLERIEAVHKQFDAGEISYEDFEERKDDLLAQLAMLPMD